MINELYKYFAGEMSSSEKKDFFERMQTDTNAQEEYARLRNAAAISGLVELKDDDEQTEMAKKELLHRVNNRQKKRFRLNVLKYVAAASILIAVSWFFSHEYMLHKQSLVYTEIKVPKGERIHITLADGTSVWLSPCTKMKYSNEFNHNNRIVELDGQGLFSVAKDAKKPFIVRTSHYDIKALGTKFEVFAYTKTPRFETCLLEGSVLVSDQNRMDEKVTLVPNEKVMLIDNKMVKLVSDFDDRNYSENGIFSFHSKPFGEILDCLSAWYDVTFQLGNSVVTSYKMSGKFRHGEELETILEALRGAYPFNFRKINDTKYEIF